MPYALLDPRFLTLSPLSLTLFSLPPLRPLLPVFRLDDVDELGRTPQPVRSSIRCASMHLMNSVEHHNPLDRPFNGPAAALYALESDRIGSGSDGRPRCVTRVWHGCRWWACRSIVLAPLASIVMIINQGVRYLSPFAFRAGSYHHEARPACMSFTRWRAAAPPSSTHAATHTHSLTGLLDPT